MTRAKILRDGVQLHASPTLGHPLMRTFQRGHVVSVIRLCETNGIASAEIRLRDGRIGYIAADAPRISFRAVVTSGDTIIYRDQSKKEILTKLPSGSPLDVGETYATEDGEKWVEAATAEGLFGFVAGSTKFRRFRPPSLSTISHRPRFRGSGWIWAALVVLLIILIHEGWLYLEMSPFQSEIESYIVAARDAASLGDGWEPYIQGKVIPVDTVKRSVDHITLQNLPKDMLANNPAEVGTVVFVTWQTQQVGTYEDGASAYQHSAYVKVVDIVHHVVTLSEKTFVGDEPPKKKYGSGTGEGSYPSTEIVDYIVKLAGKKDFQAATEDFQRGAEIKRAEFKPVLALVDSITEPRDKEPQRRTGTGPRVLKTPYPTQEEIQKLIGMAPKRSESQVRFSGQRTLTLTWVVSTGQGSSKDLLSAAFFSRDGKLSHLVVYAAEEGGSVRELENGESIGRAAGDWSWNQ